MRRILTCRISLPAERRRVFGWLLSAALVYILVGQLAFPTSLPLTVWTDVEGHIWVSNSHFTWDVSHGSSFVVKTGTGATEWRFYQAYNSYNHEARMGSGGGAQHSPGYAHTNEGAVRTFENGSVVHNADGSITVAFDDEMWHDAVTYPFDHSFTFYEDSGLIRVEYSVDGVTAIPNPPGLTYPLSLTPGGDKQNDFYYYPGVGTQKAFPYGGWASVGKSGVSPISGWAYITDYDTTTRQGLAVIAAVDNTADHITDVSYGIIQVTDTTYHGNYSHITMSMDATLRGTFYLYVYETGVTIPYSPVEDLIAGLTTPPASPTCLSATGITAGQINLVWVDNSVDETGFRIERKPQGGSFSQVAAVGADSTSYADTSVAPGAYCYRVFAYNVAGDSSASNEHCNTTTAVTSYEKLYITDFGAHEVVTADLDGSDRVEFGILGCESFGPMSIAINPIAGKLYVSNWTEHKIIMADLGGGNAQTLTQLDGSIDGPNHIALDIAAGKMYIANENTNSVTVADLDGSSPVVLDLEGALNEPYGIALDVPSGKMYVQNYSGAIVNVVQANLDGSDPVVMDLDGKLSNSRDIALDLVARKMYVVNTETNSVTRANLEGTCAEVLSLGETLSLPYGIALDVPAGKMYVVNYGTDNVVVANLDGSDAHVLALEGALSACNDIELGPGQQGGVTPPTATTAPATGVTSSGATLRGTVNAHGTAATVTFEYGLTDIYGTIATADQSPVTGDTDAAVTVSVTGLTPNTTYHYRVVAQNSGGTAHGADMTFSTGALPPAATTNAATETTATTATLNGTVNANADHTTVTFQYGVTLSYGATVNADQSPLYGSTDTAVTAAITNLSPNTTYHYRVAAQSSSSNTYGEDMTFTTLLHGDINGDGPVDLIDVLMLYRYVEGVLELTPEEVARSDIDGDGDVDEDDAVALAGIVFSS